MKVLVRICKEEKGSTIVIVALCMTILIAMVGAVTDVGIVYSNKWKMSNAVDAAVLAGAQELPSNADAARNKALDYAAKNGLTPELLTVTVSGDKTEITMVGQKEVKLLFAQILGFTKSNVQVKATARVGAIKFLTGVAPLGIQDQSFEYGKQYQLKSGDGTYGWFGPLALGGNGANTYKDNLEVGYQSELKIGDVVDTKTGNMSGPTRDGISYRISSCTRIPPCTYDNFERGCPQVLLIPVIIPEVGSGNQTKSVKIVGFASFFVDSVPGNGNESIITGYFVNEVKSGEIDFSHQDYGLRGVKLIN